MTKEILRDKTLDWVERWLDSQLCTGACWAVMILAALYFGAGFVMSGLFQGLFAALAR